MNKYLQVMEACRYLAGHCDGARQRDGQGFNGADSHVGRDLSHASQTVGWTQAQMNTAIRLLQKYRRQIEDGGLVLPKIQEITR